MTTILLVRHAHCDHVGQRLAGRMPGVHLSDRGRQEAEALGARLAGLPLAALYTSPLERSIETAQALAGPLGAEPRIVEELTEIDYGDWTGLTLDEVKRHPDWGRYHRGRSTIRIPGGERLCDVQQRVMAALQAMHARHARHAGGVVAAVSHGDAIRSAVLAVTGASLDDIDRIEVRPASVSVVQLGEDWGRLRLLNDTGTLPLA